MIKRNSKTNKDFIYKKALVIKEKLDNPNISIRELESKYNINRNSICIALKKEFGDISDNNYNIIINQSKEIIIKGQQKILKALENIDINNSKDLLYLSQSLKHTQSLISMIEGYNSNSKNQDKLIPVNIEVSYKNNTPIGGNTSA